MRDRLNKKTLAPITSVLALVAAMCAASFAPSVLAAPYALFVVATCIFVAWPRKQYTVVNLPLWTSAAGIAVFAYAALHTLVVYGFQFYYRHLLMDQDVATSSVSISSDSDSMSDSISDVVDTTVVASPSVGWMGLFDYDTFLTGDHWMVYIPFTLGYGKTKQTGSSIPAYSNLIFDLRMVGVCR